MRSKPTKREFERDNERLNKRIYELQSANDKLGLRYRTLRADMDKRIAELEDAICEIWELLKDTNAEGQSRCYEMFLHVINRRGIFDKSNRNEATEGESCSSE